MQTQPFYNKIFKKATNEGESIPFLDLLLDEHPYFGLAQFYRLKLSEGSSNNYSEVAAKTNLFFTNSLFLNKQLLAFKNTPSNAPQKFTEVEKNIEEENELSTSSKEVDIENSVSSILGEAAPSDTIVSHNEETQMLFEPLHASDYFASQGIKLSEEALANDKLGKQLKSFTAWLKTMKKVHADKLPPNNSLAETAVQTQAEKSNIEEEIVTEAMADAYILQHKYSKAVEIYSKLSLLNPSKSAYFATKIDSLKK